jgi:DNA repair protein RecO (recombination protein O)
MSRGGSIETDALVLRRFDYSETSQIARLFTRSHGRISVIAKGIKRPNRDLQGPLDLLCHARVSFAPRPEAELLVLRSYHVVTGFPGLRDVLERLIAAFYLAELLCEGTRDHDPDPPLFDLWLESFRALETSDPAGCDAIVLRAELGFLELGGFLPSLEACVHCRTALSPGDPGRLVPGRGGVLCGACSGAGTDEGLRLTAGQRRTLLHLCGLGPSRARSLAILPRDRRVLRRVLSTVLDHVLEKELHSAPFLSRSFP